MGWFGLGKKDRVIDLTKRYKEQGALKQTQSSEPEKTFQESTTSTFPSFFGDMANAAASSPNTYSESSEYIDTSDSIDNRRRKLAKRLMEMTNKMEDLSNQIYHLQQRVELLERKSGIR